MAAKTEAYVFKPMKQKLQVLALGGKEWAIIVLVAAIGAALAFVLGYWTHPAEVSIKSDTINSQIATLQSERKAVQRKASNDEQAAAGKHVSALSSSDQDLVAAAAAAGITKDTTDEEIEAMVPTTEVQQQPVIPDIPRWMVFFFAPTLITAALLAELFHNSSIANELRRVAKNARAQHSFGSDPQLFMSQHEKWMIDR